MIISDKKTDAYFGCVCAKDNKELPTDIAALEINIVNNSPVDIFIKDIKLKIGKDLHRLVDNKNPFWEEVFFFYNNDKDEKVWDGSGINYKKSGFQVPTYVSSH